VVETVNSTARRLSVFFCIFSGNLPVLRLVAERRSFWGLLEPGSYRLEALPVAQAALKW